METIGPFPYCDNMSTPTPVHKQFNDDQINDIILLFKSGKTHDEIAKIYNKPRRTIGKLLAFLKLNRDRKDIASIKSKIDTCDIVDQIRSLRVNNSLSEIAEILGSSISAVKRICDKHAIDTPSNFDELQSKRMKMRGLTIKG